MILEPAFVLVQCVQFVVFFYVFYSFINCCKAKSYNCVCAAVVDGDAACCLIGEGGYRETYVVYKACGFVWKLWGEHVILTAVFNN